MEKIVLSKIPVKEKTICGWRNCFDKPLEMGMRKGSDARSSDQSLLKKDRALQTSCNFTRWVTLGQNWLFRQKAERLSTAIVGLLPCLSHTLLICVDKILI